MNVLLVDFRAFDTLGEITVLGAAALLIFALLAGFHVHRDHRDAGIAGDWNPLIVRTATRLVLPLAALVAAFLLLRGHNLPGAADSSRAWCWPARSSSFVSAGRAANSRPAHLPYQPWIAGGLLVAALAGIGSMMFGYPFLTSTFLHPGLPVVGEVPIASATFSIIGVFVIVVAATMLSDDFAPASCRSRFDGVARA